MQLVYGNFSIEYWFTNEFIIHIINFVFVGSNINDDPPDESFLSVNLTAFLWEVLLWWTLWGTSWWEPSFEGRNAFWGTAFWGTGVTDGALSTSWTDSMGHGTSTTSCWCWISSKTWQQEANGQTQRKVGYCSNGRQIFIHHPHPHYCCCCCYCYCYYYNNRKLKIAMWNVLKTSNTSSILRGASTSSGLSKSNSGTW